METRDVDVSLQAAHEFAQMLKKLESEDLPRHEQRFHQMLKEGTIQKIAMFQANLDKERQDIIDKLDKSTDKKRFCLLKYFYLRLNGI